MNDLVNAKCEDAARRLLYGIEFRFRRKARELRAAGNGDHDSNLMAWLLD